MLDLLIVLSYFGIIFTLALRGRVNKNATVEEYFLSSRNLKWPSIAISTIATNIQGYQFLGMMGSAYLFGLAQASLEINAVQGILLAAFVFVPLFLKEQVITVTQYIKKRLGKTIALFYTGANILIFSTITLGAALFWGAYAADQVFGEYFTFISDDPFIRILVLIIALGIFSAIYTYLGGLNAVVKTDIIQFSILIIGGVIVLFVSIHHLGGWGQLYEKTGDKMHLYLPADHETLPWIHLFGLFFLNINYWCANQTIMQRSLAAKSLRHAQIGLMAGGVMKYVMAILIVIPGIALFGFLGDQGLPDPDMAFPYLVNTYLPIGLKGIILCALFASLMSTVDSTFNSLATLWSIDIYKEYINQTASDSQVIRAGKNTILVTLFTGMAMGFVLLNIKLKNPEIAFTHTLNELRYYVNCGIVVLIITAALIITPNRRGTLLGFLLTVPLHLIIIYVNPDINYFFRAFLVIATSLLFVFGLSYRGGFRSLNKLFVSDSRQVTRYGIVLLVSLILIHIVFR